MSNTLSATEIVDSIKSNNLRIAYYSVTDSNNDIVKLTRWKFLNLNPDDDEDEEDKLVREYFYKNLEPDSYRLTLGPYCVIEKTQGNIGKENVFKHGEDLAIDIKEAGHLLLYPNQFFVLGSNEYIEVSDKLGGTILPNVRNTDVGLSPPSGCIDPTWKGIIQLGMINLTDYTKQLYYMDAVCLVRFHRHSKPVSAELSERFSSKRPHFGNNWWQIEDEKGRSIFPRRKEYSVGGEFRSFYDMEKRKEKWLVWLKKVAAGVGAAGFISLVAYLTNLSNKMTTASDNSIAIASLSEKISALESTADRLADIDTYEMKIPPSKIGKIYNNQFNLPKGVKQKPFSAIRCEDISKISYKFEYIKGTNGNYESIRLVVESLIDTSSEISIQIMIVSYPEIRNS